ncbi:ArnT family glycosyltransferase [Halobaculum magnesiiphilum]|uniref:Glycosyltransferase family 39 protein n=1 Tax=Halobaculum magnesiiphilum TaxID=1017351 RepID=A0A8T8WIL6_9EURY|nr:glycosyltransferase family 39 protein [Halobaculum magnesiiphilum]QZP39678.1 glycosyltransferase family 39 protein [Halobaculum magnesiiphilum]
MTGASTEHERDESAGSEDGTADRAVAAVRSRLDAGRVAAIVLAAIGAAVAVVVATGVFPFRSLNHDEGVYLQQADMLLSGQVFLRPPVEDAFRPWFFVDSERGLYSKYAPVPSTVFALGKLLGGYTVALAGIAAGLVAGTVALGRELFDARVGALAGVLLLATPLFVVHSGVFLPYALTAALNVAFAVWYLRGERRESRRDATLAGVAVGLAFFARPYTAVLFATPFVLHAVVTLTASGAWRVPPAAAELVDEPTDEQARGLFARRLITAALGTAGVLATLGYNAVVTGDPFLFPYLAFAPEDGVGFGERAILGHVVDYTPELGIEANRLVLDTLFTDWVVAGSLGAAAAATGVALALVGRGLPGDDEAGDGALGERVRRGLLAATFASVAAGNVAFWGNFNVLGALEVRTDGLIYYLGPYYHYDLIVPTAVFAAVACVALADGLRGAATQLAERAGRIDARHARAVATVALLVGGAAAGGVAAGAVEDTVERNEAVTEELRAGYGPLVADGDPGAAVPEDSVLFLPTPYGPWLNHPFQALRNDPGHDGPRVYALGDTRELEVAREYPNRDLYRYVYAGSWVPTDDSTVRGGLREVERVAGDRLYLNATLQRPESVEGTTVRVTGDRGSTYLVATDSGGPLSLSMVVEDGELTVSGEDLVVSGGEGGEAEGAVLPLDDGDEIDVEVFVSTGPATGYSYRLSFPYERIDGTARALTATAERCPVPTRCVPQGVGESPPDRGIEVTLTRAT